MRKNDCGLGYRERKRSSMKIEASRLIIFRHRTEGSREIVLRLRELSVLPPLKAN